MITITQYIVDAFTDKVFYGNPAAVCLLDKWLPDETLQAIAKENNYSETAYTMPNDDGTYGLRWFTPGGEVKLCGHATLATAFVLLTCVDAAKTSVTFHTLSGDLVVTKKDGLFSMDFPSYALTEVPVTDAMEAAIGVRPVKAYMGDDLLCVLPKATDVITCEPNMDAIKELDGLLLHITAPGRDYDCVSRSFAPKLNVPEDPVCGRGHCHIVPYWAGATGKHDIYAFQASPRSGVLYCTYNGDRTVLGGKAALFSTGEIYV